MTPDLNLAYDYCRRVAKEHARNFYYAFRTLPEPKRRAIYAAYAFCRLCDDISDEELSLEEKQRRFTTTRRLLTEAQSRQTSNPVFMAILNTTQSFGIPWHYLEEIIEGVEMDLTKTRFQTFQELRAYCYKVASTVGLICIEVFGYEDNRAKDYAIELGLAMQLTNILRDIREDKLRGRIYIPLDEMASFGYSEQELIDGVNNDAFQNLMRFQTERARHYFESSKRLVPLLSPRTRVCLVVLHKTYSLILDRIEASGFQVFDRRVELSKQQKLFIAAKLWAGSLITEIPLLRR